MTDSPDMPEMTEQQKAAMAGAERVDVSVSYERPGVVTLIGIILFIQAAMAAGAAAALLINASDADHQGAFGVTENELVSAGVVEAVFAVLFLLVGWGIMTGWNGSRIAVAVCSGSFQ